MNNIKLGYKKRPIKEMEIFYGADLVSGVKQTRTLVPNGTFYSGEPMIAKHDAVGFTSKWEKITADDLKTKAPVSFAFTDSDRFDVQCSGKLLGIEGSTDTFVLGTAFYDTSKNYKEGDPLYLQVGKVVKDGEYFKVVAAAGAGDAVITNVGILTNAETNAGEDAVVGYVQGIIKLQGNAPIQTGAEATNAVGPEGYIVQAPAGKDKAISGGPALWTEASGTREMLQFSTTFIPGAGA